jgi:site-specific DNA recombinase
MLLQTDSSGGFGPVGLATDHRSFVTRLRHSAQTLSVTERQKVVRLLIKDIVVEVDNRITIRHCLPLMGGVRNASGGKVDCYPLCTGSH